MKKYIVKQQRKMLLIIMIFIITAMGIYIYAPGIESLNFRRKVGSLDEWSQYCNNADSSLLMYDSPYWGGGEDGEYTTYTPSLEDDVVFSFDGVMKIDDGVYITGLRGLTNWCILLSIYTRKSCMLDAPIEHGDEYRYWSFYVTCEGAGNNSFPFKRNTEDIGGMTGKSLKGYSVNVYLAAPKSIGKDSTITLLYNTGKYFDKQKEIRIPVVQKAIK